MDHSARQAPPPALARQPDHLIFCISQPSLSARDEARLLAALRHAAQKTAGPTVSTLRLEGTGTSLPTALRAARDAGAGHVRVMPVGFPMAANIMAWLPGAIAHFAATEGADMQVELAAPPETSAAADALLGVSLAAPVHDLSATRPALGSPGWQFLPDFDTHILVCTGPRCAFRGAGTLQARLKAQLAAAGLSDRCLTATTGCLYPCNQGPVLAIYPAGKWFHVPDEAALDRIVTEVIAGRGNAPDLQLAERPGSRRAQKTPPKKRIT